MIDGASLSGLSRNDKARLSTGSSATCSKTSNLLRGSHGRGERSLPLELDGVSQKKARVKGMSALEALGLADRAVRAIPINCPGANASGLCRSPGRGG